METQKAEYHDSDTLILKHYDKWLTNTFTVFYIVYYSLKLTTYHVFGKTDCFFYVDQIVLLSKCFQ